MCKEDIRLARAASPTQAKSVTPTAAGIIVLTANPNRYALSAKLDTAMDATMSGAVVLAARINGTYYPLIGLSKDHPADTVSLTDVGTMIEGEIFAILLDVLYVGAVTVAETAFTQQMSEI